MKKFSILLCIFFLLFNISGCSNTKYGDEGYGFNKSSQESQSDTKKESEESQNQGNQKSQCTDEECIYTCPCTNVGDEGSQEQETSYITCKVIVYGLNDQILFEEQVEMVEGESAFSALQCVCDKNSISYSTSGLGKFAYITEINGLKEKENGMNSGWKYSINGEYVSKGCARYILEDEDVMEWVYVSD